MKPNICALITFSVMLVPAPVQTADSTSLVAQSDARAAAPAGAKYLKPKTTKANENIAGSAEVLSIEGNAMIQFSRSGWQQAQVGAKLKTGNRVRTGKGSHVTIRLADKSVLRLNELSVFEFGAASRKTGKPTVHLEKGSALFFRREKATGTEINTRAAAGVISG